MNLDLRLFQEAEKAYTTQLEQLASEIIAGKATDYADYRYRIGRIKGLQDALATLQEAQSKLFS